MWFLPKDYVWVHTRVEKLHAEHKENISIDTNFELQGEVAIFKAVVKTGKWHFSGSSFWKLWKEKAFEKLETVAVGRALAFAWYDVKSWIASREENEEWEKKEGEKKFFNYEDLLEASEAWNTTIEDIQKIVEWDGFIVSANAKKAIAHWANTGEVVKNLFYNKK